MPIFFDPREIIPPFSVPPKKQLSVVFSGNDPAALSYLKTLERDGLVSVISKFKKGTPKTEVLSVIPNRKNPYFITDFPDGTPSGSYNKFELPVPCAAQAVVDSFRYFFSKMNLIGSCVVVFGRGKIGSPVLESILSLPCTVISVNSSTKNPEQFAKHADVIIFAASEGNLVPPESIRAKVIIDVGFHPGTDYSKVPESTIVLRNIGYLTRAILRERVERFGV